MNCPTGKASRRCLFAFLPYYFNVGRLNATRLTKWLWLVASSFLKPDILVPFRLLRIVAFASGR